ALLRQRWPRVPGGRYRGAGGYCIAVEGICFDWVCLGCRILRPSRPAPVTPRRCDAVLCAERWQRPARGVRVTLPARARRGVVGRRCCPAESAVPAGEAFDGLEEGPQIVGVGLLATAGGELRRQLQQPLAL